MHLPQLSKLGKTKYFFCGFYHFLGRILPPLLALTSSNGLPCKKNKIKTKTKVRHVVYTLNKFKGNITVHGIIDRGGHGLRFINRKRILNIV